MWTGSYPGPNVLPGSYYSTRLDTDQGEQCSERAVRVAQYVDAVRTVQVLFWYAVSRTDTRMTGSYLYYSVNWVQSARRTTERGRARREPTTQIITNANATHRTCPLKKKKNKCEPISDTFLF